VTEHCYCIAVQGNIADGNAVDSDSDADEAGVTGAANEKCDGG